MKSASQNFKVNISAPSGEMIYNFIYSSAENNFIDAGAANDFIFGYDGDDIINGNDGFDIISAAGGNDQLSGGAKDDSIYGQGGNDNIKGDDGNDILFGDDGDDIINGGNGNDEIYGGSGFDILTGGAGNDLFDFDTLEDSADVITDFTKGEDQIAFFDLGFTNIVENIDGAAAQDSQTLFYNYDQIANETIISNFDNNFVIKLSGDIHLDQSDFIF